MLMRPLGTLVAASALCAGMAACGAASSHGPAGSAPPNTTKASAPTASARQPASTVPAYTKVAAASLMSKHVKFISVRQLPHSEGDADNPKDIDGNPDPDGRIDRDEDTYTRASFRFPDGDEAYNFGYGEAADPSDRRMLAAVLTRYYEAARAGDATTACAIMLPSLAATVTANLMEGAKRHPGETCESAMGTVFERDRRELLANVEVADVRVDGTRAEVIFGSRTMLTSDIYFQPYGGVWKLEDAVAARVS